MTPVTGKSNSLFGSQGNPGIIRRSLREMYRSLHSRVSAISRVDVKHRVAAQRKAEGESSYTFHVSVLLITSDAAVDLLADRRRRGAQVRVEDDIAFETLLTPFSVP